jgi:protein-S-isoprenylcysteine O-methyltransferase
MYDPYPIIGWAWGIVAAVWFVSSFTSKRTARRQSAGSRLVQLGLAAFAALLISGKGPWKQVLSRQIIPHSFATANLGLALTLAGLTFALWARFMLGRNWSGTVTIKRDHELVRSGPYAFVRHPIYSGFLLALLGTVIAAGTLGASLGLAVVVLVLRMKSLTEESFMLEQFGSQYADYKRHVKALVPFVW